jgi:uncharacterized protein YkwD
LGLLGGIFQLLLFVVIVVLIYFVITHTSSLSNLNIANFNLSNLSSFFNNFNVTQPANLNYTTPTPPQNYLPQNQVVVYALSLINNDRSAYGLSNVSYSNITSAQQHSDSMLQYGYFSHWDTFGLKPYMRYTALNGTEGVDENVAYIYNSSGVNVLSALKQMEYSMMYNDAECCNNGHRYNILNPQHNQVSIGVAYNRTTIYLTEDFIDNYIVWQSGTPSYNNGAISLDGAALSGYSLSSVQISYDAPIMNMTNAQLAKTSSYGIGKLVAGVGHTGDGRVYYFPNVTTINATTYETQNNNFAVSFNMNNLESTYGQGEYNLLVFLTNNTANENGCYNDSEGISHCNTFLAVTYTIFINQSGERYVPQNV